MARHRGVTIPLAVAVAAVSVNLRPMITTVGPQLQVITDHLGTNDTVAGLITAGPVFAFAAVSLVAPRILSRLTIRHGLYLALAATGAGIAVRPWAGTVGFVLATFAGALGIGVISVLVPVLIRESTASSPRLVAVFTTALQAGAALGFAATVPLADALGGWQVALASWAVLAPIGAIALWRSLDESDTPRGGLVPRLNPLGIIGAQRAYSVTAFFGLQAMVAFVAIGWLPSILQTAGVPTATAGVYAAVLTFIAVPVSLVVPPYVVRSTHPSRWLAGFSAFTVVGILGLLLAPSAAPLAWSVLLGVGLSVFSLVMAVVTVQAPPGVEAVAFSGAVQGVGYLVATVGPFAVGLLRTIGGGWSLPLGALLSITLLQLLTATRIGTATPNVHTKQQRSQHNAGHRP